MEEDLSFTPEEEERFKRMTKITPVGWGQKLSLFIDAKANSVSMFIVLLAYGILSPILFPRYLNQLLYIGNVYQLAALPILGVATGLSTYVILRFLFRIFSKLNADVVELKIICQTQQEELAELKLVNQRLLELIDLERSSNKVT